MMTLYSQSNCRSKPVILGHDVCYFKQFIWTEKDISGLNRVHHNITICPHACLCTQNKVLKILYTLSLFSSACLCFSASISADSMGTLRGSRVWRVKGIICFWYLDVYVQEKSLHPSAHRQNYTHARTIALSLSLSNTILFLTLNSYIYTFLFAQQH